MRGAITSLFAIPAVALAGGFDLDLARYTDLYAEDQTFTVNGKPFRCDQAVCVIADNDKFYSLASEMGVVLAPPLLSPSETLGFAGFAIGATFGFTTISENADFWKAAGSYEFANNDPFPQGAAAAAPQPGTGPPSGIAKTVGAVVRKGLWLPVPSFELGLGFRHLLDSSVFALQADAKIALHEGFHNWPLPEIAVRGSGSRAMGDTTFDLTVVGLDFSASKQLGLFGTVNLTPYAGYQFLWIVADPDVLDATPGCDPVAGGAKGDIACPPVTKMPPKTDVVICSHDDCNANFVFFNPNAIERQRIFVGMRLNFDPGSLTGEWAYAREGKSDAQFVEPFSEETIRVTDRASSQHTFSIQAGLDF